MSSPVRSGGHDDTPASSHRLPTVSAYAALRRLRVPGAHAISTGLPRLDKILVGPALATYGCGGIVRGQLTEVFGPPGSGTSAFGLQLARKALENAGCVVWIGKKMNMTPMTREALLIRIDCVYPLARPRMHRLVDTTGRADKLYQFMTPTLPHLLALVHHQKLAFPPENTTLMVIDQASALFASSAHSQATKPSSASSKPVGPLLQSTLLAALSKMASSYNIAVLMISHVITRIRNSTAAQLISAIGSNDWMDSMPTRLVIFRDFSPLDQDWDMPKLPDSDELLLDRLRYIGVLKASGMAAMEDDVMETMIPFSLSTSGAIIPIESRILSSTPATVASSVASAKRGYKEIPDSEEEWGAEVEEDDDPTVLLQTMPQDKKARTDKS